MAVGTTADFKLTRDQLITLAFQTIGKLSELETLPGEQLQIGIKFLNLLVRETDDAGKWIWAYEDTKSLTLVANTFIYTSANGLPTNISHLEKVMYRNSQGQDAPVDILTREGYEDLREKIETGDPTRVYLDDKIVLANRSLFVSPMLGTVNSQSEVLGSDALNYRCIRSHLSATDNKPITGANYLLYWEQAGASGSAWAVDTQYTAPQLLRLTFYRPLYDFDTASDTPDLPNSWPRALFYRLCNDLADMYRVPLEERAYLGGKAAGALKDIKRKSSIKKPTTRAKAEYF